MEFNLIICMIICDSLLLLTVQQLYEINEELGVARDDPSHNALFTAIRLLESLPTPLLHGLGPSC